MSRGRGTLTVRKSNNPFFQTTQGDIGYNADKQADSNAPEWKSPLTDHDFKMAQSMNLNEEGKEFTAADTQKLAYDKGNFGFLYTRTSDTIGSKVPKPSMEAEDNGRMIIAQPKSKAEFLRDCYKSKSVLAMKEQMIQTNGTANSMKISAEDTLKSYKHAPKVEDARYTTTNNEIGKRAPTVATFVSERAGIPQDFSRGFNNIKPQNTSLNTGITKSTIHPKLDPQFA